MRLPERMARRAEGIAAIYQDDAAGREAGCVPDYPKGGQDSAPNPIQLLLSALGACTTVTLQMYADHKDIQLEHVQVDLALNPNAEQEAGQNNIVRKITLKGDFTEDQHKRLLKVAENCPVHKLLT